MQKIWRNFIGQNRCMLCQQAGNGILCKHCDNSLPWNSSACLKCASPIPNSNSTPCGQCLQQNQDKFTICLTALLYEYPIRELIHAYKFNGQLYWAKLFAYLLLRRLSLYYPSKYSIPQAIIAIPLHKRRLRKRGFNQAQQLAKPIAQHFGIPLISGCDRIRNTNFQHQLDHKQRHLNVANAFSANKLEQIKSIAIVDDLITTGTTINEISATITEKNPDMIIHIWCLAKAKLKH